MRDMDISIYYRPRGGKNDSVQAVLALPALISKNLKSRNYNRVKVIITDEGILLKPYAANDLELPDWMTAETTEDEGDWRDV